MAHRFSIKEIAHQAGLSTATVDRVLHGRSGVRRQTANRVRNAIRELEAQEAQLSMSGRKLMLDLIVEASQAFLDALHAAVVRELPVIQTAIFRVRSDMRTLFPVDQIAAGLDRARKLGSDGVIVMAPDAPAIHQAIDRLTGAGIPVVTLATDMPATSRTAYAGLDNLRAGETAAWLIRKWAPTESAPHVLVTVRNEAFRGEVERERGFRDALAHRWPGAGIELLVQGHEGPAFADRVARAAVERKAAALYSIGGGNRNILNTLDAAGLQMPVIIAHDLDPDNLALLAENRIDAILYHDLAEDIRNACQVVMSVHSKGTIPRPANGATLRVMLPPMLASG